MKKGRREENRKGGRERDWGWGGGSGEGWADSVEANARELTGSSGFLPSRSGCKKERKVCRFHTPPPPFSPPLLSPPPGPPAPGGVGPSRLLGGGDGGGGACD